MKMCVRNYHSYTHLIPDFGIVREPTIWRIMTSKYSCTDDIGPAAVYGGRAAVAAACAGGVDVQRHVRSPASVQRA